MTEASPDSSRPTLLAAAVTPMTSGGSAVDLDAVAPMMRFLESHGVDGVLAGGTTGEGILLDVAERRALTQAFRDAIYLQKPIDLAALVRAVKESSRSNRNQQN